MLLYFIIIVVLFLIAYVVHKHNFLRQIYLSSKIPGPSSYPIIGNGLLFLNKSAVENLQTIHQIVRENKGVARIWIGPELNILVSDPKDVEVILSSSKFIDKASLYKFVKPWLNEGLLTSNSSKWFKRRKILTPAFHFKILEDFVEVFDRQGNTLIKKLTTYKMEDKVELYPLVTLYALDVICESAMGTTVNAQNIANSDYVIAVKEMANTIHLRMLDFLLRIDFFFVFSKLAIKQSKALKILQDFTDNVIRERRSEILKRGRNAKETPNNVGEKRKIAFLDLLLQATIDGKPLTNLDIREEVDTFMFEGHDTTTSAITFSLYNIAKYPEIQKNCFLEIQKMVNSDIYKPVTMNELNNLHYLELVIKETLRLFPSVPLMGRVVREEVTINNYTYPVGANLIVPPFCMGRDASIFPEPEIFRPERYDIENTAETMNPYAYIPFSAGPRNCIGQKFAMLEMKAILTKILRNFEISLAPDSLAEPTLTAELILVPQSKINFHLKLRS